MSSLFSTSSQKGIFGNSSSVVTYGMGMPDGKRIGINSAGAKILCRAHNSMLSVVEDELLRLSHATAEFWESPQTSSVAIDGRLIERWMLKIVIEANAAGLFCGRRMQAEDSAVRQLFGGEPLNPRFVLYGVSTPVTRGWNRSVAIAAIKRPGHPVDMMLVIVNDLPLLAYVGDEDPEKALQSAEPILGIDVTEAKVVCRPSKMQLSHGDVSDRLTIAFSYQ